MAKVFNGRYWRVGIKEYDSISHTSHERPVIHKSDQARMKSSQRKLSSELTESLDSTLRLVLSLLHKPTDSLEVLAAGISKQLK